jgi:enoyl-CoA hydratase/3-hydroxyacyl-CoA dehydrogenase
MKKTAVTVGNCPGFLVNRIFMPYGMATGFLVDRGVHPYRIDRALFAFGMPMGPCRMIDLAGIDVGVYAQQIMDAAYSDRSYRSPIRELLVAAGRLGEKSGKGHYDYAGGKAAEDPTLDSFLDEARKRAGNPETIDVSDEEIVHITLFGVVNEACRALHEGVVSRASDIDVASILGMGFPAYRGGPMKWADLTGVKRVHDSLAGWYERFGTALFRPSELLAEKAKRGESLT